MRLVQSMDAGELREYLTEKYAFGYSSAHTRSVQQAERRLGVLLNRPFHEIRDEIVADAQRLREDTK